MIFEDPCEHCGQPLTVRKNGNVEDMTIVDACAVRRCLYCYKALSLESLNLVDIDDIHDEVGQLI